MTIDYKQLCHLLGFPVYGAYIHQADRAEDKLETIKNTDIQKLNTTRKNKQHKTTLVQLPITTLGLTEQAVFRILCCVENMAGKAFHLIRLFSVEPWPLWPVPHSTELLYCQSWVLTIK